MKWSSVTIRERFNDSYIPEPNSGCWVWTKSLQGRGYAQLSVGSAMPERGNIVSYRLHKGDIPNGMHVRHTCDCRWCVNPDHLILGTNQDNVDDAVRRGRNAKGETNGAAKISEADAIAILADYRDVKVVAAEYGLSARMVSLIKARKRWKHLPAPIAPSPTLAGER